MPEPSETRPTSLRLELLFAIILVCYHSYLMLSSFRVRNTLIEI